MSKRVFLRTFGCQMNIRDSEVIAGLLNKTGYRLTENEKNADVLIFNTCSVRQHAEDKVWSAVGRYKTERHPSTRKAAPLIGIVGCMANCYREDIFRRAPQVDFIAGTRDIGKLPEIIKNCAKKNALLQKKYYEVDGRLRDNEIYHNGFHLDKKHAFVVISEGCENFCSYCVVPYTRGKLTHRKPKDIIKEIEENITSGINRVTLLGQNVNAYQSGINFVQLLKLVNKTEGLKEFGFITSHPKDTTIELFKAMGDLDRLKKYLHLPVQSGSDRILKLMNRGYTRKFYLELADNYRKIVRDSSLTTDIILGFPTESDKDFRDTYNLVKEIQFDAAYIFKYSPRPHTRASGLDDDIGRQEKERRHALVLELQKRISRNKRGK